jgi:hypothetical protein
MRTTFPCASRLLASMALPPGFSSQNGEFSMEIVGVGELLCGKLAVDDPRTARNTEN